MGPPKIITEKVGQFQNRESLHESQFISSEYKSSYDRLSQNQINHMNQRFSVNKTSSRKSIQKSINNIASKSYDSFKFLTNAAFEKETTPDVESQDSDGEYFSLKSIKVQIARCVHRVFDGAIITELHFMIEFKKNSGFFLELKIIFLELKMIF